MKWYSIRAASSGTQELLIYGDIGESWSAQSVIAADLVKDLSSLQASTINARISSHGGSVADGLAIYNALRRHPARVVVDIDSVAVSIASLIAMAGDEVHIAENGQIMIHAPWTQAQGNAGEFREVADLLDRHAESMVSAYAGRLGEKEARRMLTDGANHWFSAQEALAAGLVDSVSESLAIAAHFDLTRYGVPKMTEPTEPKKPDLEVVARTEEEVMARIRARNDEVNRAFAFHERIEGAADLKAAILADPAVTIEQARAQLLDLIGKGAEPINRAPMQMRASWGGNRHHSDFMAAATDALLQRAGVPVDEPHPGAQDLRGRSLVAIAETMVTQRGGTFVDTSPVGVIRAALTTSDFPLLLSNTANKSLMRGYEDEPATHRQWTRPTEVGDFKEVTRAAISEAPALEEILEDGKYRQGSLSERAESFELKTYGKMLVITRKALINDDLGSFTRIPQAFGASGARLEADLVYGLLTSNPAMSDGTDLFHADHNNLETAAALSIVSLGNARKAMRKQKGIAGLGLLNLVPRYLIVPAALETSAEQLLASLVDPTKSNDTPNLKWIRGLELVVDARLDEDSETAWYLAANHNQVDTVEVAHLAGQRGVFTEDDTEFSSDNYRIKARLDFATQVIDWVGMVKNPGA